MYSEELLDRNLHPCFKGTLSGIEPIVLVNSSCGDELKIYLKVEDGKIKNGRWSGAGCAISVTSADYFIESVIGKTIEEAQALKEEFSKLIIGEKEELLGLNAMKCVSRMPARAKCAKLAWCAVEKIAEKS